MNELLAAAKAVIDAEDIPTRCAGICKLRAAVERAEKRNADFDKWFVKNYEGVFDLAIYESIRTACISATQANLIAAAPEMLDMLKECRATLASVFVYGVPEGMVDRVNALIQKAEGNDLGDDYAK